MKDKYREMRQHNKAFTLIETLVAVSILTLVIIGPMTIAAKGMQMAFYANEQITAVFLAQEAIESIHNLRDQTALVELSDYQHDGSDGDGNTFKWYNDLLQACKEGDGCDLDTSNNTYHSCGNANDCKLEIVTDGSSHHYGYGGDPSVYTRVITLGEIVNGGVSVNVTVTWPPRIQLFGTGATDRSVVLHTWVYDQYKRFE